VTHDVVNAFAQAAFTEGAIPMVVWTASPPGPAGMVDDFLSVISAKGALLKTDCWVEVQRAIHQLLQTHGRGVLQEQETSVHDFFPASQSDGLVRLFVWDQYALRDFRAGCV